MKQNTTERSIVMVKRLNQAFTIDTVTAFVVM
jgi:hypothetical protein